MVNISIFVPTVFFVKQRCTKLEVKFRCPLSRSPKSLSPRPVPSVETMTRVCLVYCILVSRCKPLSRNVQYCFVFPSWQKCYYIYDFFQPGFVSMQHSGFKIYIQPPAPAPNPIQCTSAAQDDRVYSTKTSSSWTHRLSPAGLLASRPGSR